MRFHEFDIIGIQEGLNEQLNDLSKMEEYLFLGVGRIDGKTKGEYSAIFYKKERFKLLNKGNFWLSETPEFPSFGWGANYQRICSWGEFEDKNSGKTFFVFNVHFDHQSVEARRQSANLMVKKIKEIAGENTVICTGDFNAVPNTEEIRTMNNLFQDSFTASKMAPYGPVGTFNGFNFNAPIKNDKRIDYIFVSKNEFSLKTSSI